MFTKPVDVDDAQVGDALLAGWALTVDEIAYAAVGFGSYHWHVAADGGRWFVTVDDLVARRRDERETNADAGARLSAALRTARALRDAGLDFVVAAKPTHAGCIVHAIDERYVVALHRHVDGTTHRSITYADRAARLAVLDRLVAVHGASNAVADIALVDDLVIPARDKLADALDDSSIRWGPGPYAEGAHRLLDSHRQAVHRLMAHYDALVVSVGASREPMVITHGEPHRANTIVTTAGVALIDWDTALLARRERDLWMLIDEDPQIANDYTERTGVTVDADAVELYRLWWDLCEISLYVTRFRRPHDDTEDTRVAWQGLQRYLDPSRWRIA